MSNLYSDQSSGVTVILDYDGGTQAIYVGEAIAGTATSLPAWRIKKLTYDGNANVTNVQWANAE
ncbi:unnamed protein product, partial [marine sediment metagenome]